MPLAKKIIGASRQSLKKPYNCVPSKAWMVPADPAQLIALGLRRRGKSFETSIWMSHFKPMLTNVFTVSTPVCSRTQMIRLLTGQ